MCTYLDADGSGDIDFNEFSAKVNFKDYFRRQHEYTISKVSFLETVAKAQEKKYDNERERFFEECER